MKRGSGMDDREERSEGIEIRIADAFAIIKPTVPFKLNKDELKRKETCCLLLINKAKAIEELLLFTINQ